MRARGARTIPSDCSGGLLDHEVTMSEVRRITTEEARSIGTRLGVDWAQVELEQLRRGLEVEAEHGAGDPETDLTYDDLNLTGRIARAHRLEIRSCSTRLDQLEAEAEDYERAGTALLVEHPPLTPPPDPLPRVYPPQRTGRRVPRSAAEGMTAPPCNGESSVYGRRSGNGGNEAGAGSSAPCVSCSPLHDSFSVPRPRQRDWTSHQMGRGFWGATIRDNKLMAVRGTRTSGEAMELILPGRGWIPNSAVSTLKLGRVTSPEIRVRSRTSMSPRPFLGWAATDSVAARRQSLHTPALGGSGCARPILELLGRQGITASSPAIRVPFLGLPKDIGTMCGLGRQRVVRRRTGTDQWNGTGRCGEKRIANRSGRLENW